MDTTIKWIFTFWFLVSYWFRSWLNILKNHEKSKDIVWISCMKFVTIIGLLECHIWETNILRTSLDLQNNFGNGLWNSFQKCRVTFESNFWHGHFFFFFFNIFERKPFSLDFRRIKIFSNSNEYRNRQWWWLFCDGMPIVCYFM